MKQKLASLVILAVLLSSFVFDISAFASEEMPELELLVTVNETKILDSELFILENETIYVQLRSWLDRLGQEVTWLPHVQMAHFRLMGLHFYVSLDSNVVVVNDSEIVMDAATLIIDGSLYIPFEFMAKWSVLSYEIDLEALWISIETEEAILFDEEIEARIHYTDEELYLLARIIDVEAGGGSLLKQVMVGNVIMNRVNCERFDDSIEGVVYARGQFPPAHRSGFETREPRPNAWIAARRVLAGNVILEDSYYFNNRPFSWKSSEDLILVIEGEYFYR